MKKFVIYSIVASLLFVTSCSKSDLGVTMPEEVHPEGCTPIDIELFSGAQTRVTVESKNIDSYYLIIDQADETDTDLAITGTRYDYVVKVKRTYIPDTGETADQYKSQYQNGDWGNWEIYDMIIDAGGSVVEGAKRILPMYIYKLDEKYYFDKSNDDVLREEYEAEYAYYEWEYENWLLDPSQPEPTPPTPPTYVTDPSKNTTPNLKYTVVKWDAKNGELFKVVDNKIVLNDADIDIDLSSVNYKDVYHNDLIFSAGDKEHIKVNGGFKLMLYPVHQFARLDFEFEFNGNFRNIYYYGTSSNREHYPLTNTKDAANHESVIYSLDIKPANPIEYLSGFNLITGKVIAREASIDEGVVDIDLMRDIEHYFPNYYFSNQYTASFQMLVSPNQITADGLPGDYNMSVKVTTKKYVVDNDARTYTMDETKRDREFSYITTNITQDSFGSGKAMEFKFDIGDSYTYN